MLPVPDGVFEAPLLACSLLYAYIFLARRWCGDGDMGFSWPGSAPCAPNSVASFVQPVRASLHFRPAGAPKVAHIPITAPAAALCVLARTQARAGCLAFLRRAWLIQKNLDARPERPASRGARTWGQVLAAVVASRTSQRVLPKVEVCDVTH